MNLTETQQKFLDTVCSQPGGVDIHEAMELTGYDYKTLEKTAYELISKGIEVKALPICEGIRPGGWIKRFYLSPYDQRYNELIKGRN